MKISFTLINYTPTMSPEVISSLSGEAAFENYDEKVERAWKVLDDHWCTFSKFPKSEIIENHKLKWLEKIFDSSLCF